MISTSINQFTSSVLLCIMSADRYIAVCHPISSPTWRTPLISKVVSLLAWTFSIVLIIPIIQHAKEIEIDGKSNVLFPLRRSSTKATFQHLDRNQLLFNDAILRATKTRCFLQAMLLKATKASC
nr:unnamed protein product [Callosobruchus chinensis]